MEKNISNKNLVTQAEYARMIGKTRARVNQMIKEKKVTSVIIGGNRLIYVPEKHNVLS